MATHLRLKLLNFHPGIGSKEEVRKREQRKAKTSSQKPKGTAYQMQCVTYGQATDRWVKMVFKETITHQINSDSLVNFSQFSLFVVFETDA